MTFTVVLKMALMATFLVGCLNFRSNSGAHMLGYRYIWQRGVRHHHGCAIPYHLSCIRRQKWGGKRYNLLVTSHLCRFFQMLSSVLTQMATNMVQSTAILYYRNVTTFFWTKDFFWGGGGERERCRLDLHVGLLGHILFYPISTVIRVACLALYAVTCGVPLGRSSS